MFRLSRSETAKQNQDPSEQTWSNLHHSPFKDVQDYHEESFPWVKKTAILIATHDKKDYNGSSKSLACLNIQHKSIIHSILVYYKKRREASACVELLPFRFGWLLSSQNKDSKITDLRQRTIKTKAVFTWDPIWKMTGLSFGSVYKKKSYRDGGKILVCNSLVKLC